MTSPADPVSPPTFGSARRILAGCLVLLAAAAIGLALDRRMGVGILAGGVLSTASLTVSTLVFGRVFTVGRMGCMPGLLFIVKFLLLLAAVGLCVRVFEIDPLGLVIGFSVILPSILIEALRKFPAR